MNDVEILTQAAKEECQFFWLNNVFLFIYYELNNSWIRTEEDVSKQASKAATVNVSYFNKKNSRGHKNISHVCGNTQE